MFAFESKFAALSEIFLIENISESWSSVKLTPEEFLAVISRPEYNLKIDLGFSAGGIAKLLKRLVPEKGRSTKICSVLLAKYSLKYCPKCGHVYWFEDFHNNSNDIWGKDSYCKVCFHEYVRPLRAETEASKRAHLKHATPSWANKPIIKSFYAQCPKGYHVDHIVPLNGELVCGLHVENNLQYLLAKDNIEKSNKFIIE